MYVRKATVEDSDALTQLRIQMRNEREIDSSVPPTNFFKTHTDILLRQLQMGLSLLMWQSSMINLLRPAVFVFTKYHLLTAIQAVKPHMS